MTLLTVSVLFIVACALVGFALRCVGELLKVAVVIVFGIAVLSLLGCTYKASEEEPKHETMGILATVSRPAACAHLRIPVSERVWDNERHEYVPTSSDWYTCMGVEYRE